MANIGVLGAGSWGTALSVLLHDNGNQATIWSIDPAEIEMLSKEREHKTKLPGVHISEEIQITGEIQEAILGKDFLVLAVPSPFTRATAKKMSSYVAEGQIIVDVAKGIEETTLMTLSGQIKEEIPQADVAVLSGPSHAEEVGRKLPTTCVIGATTRKTAEYLQSAFMSKVFRVYTSPDILGIELGGSLKNVIALAAGIADGLGYGDNTKAALITRGIAEIARLGVNFIFSAKARCVIPSSSIRFDMIAAIACEWQIQSSLLFSIIFIPSPKALSILSSAIVCIKNTFALFCRQRYYK